MDPAASAPLPAVAELGWLVRGSDSGARVLARLSDGASRVRRTLTGVVRHYDDVVAILRADGRQPSLKTQIPLWNTDGIRTVGLGIGLTSLGTTEPKFEVLSSFTLFVFRSV